MNNRGSLTVDYLFAFFLVSGFCLVIITLSVTLSTVEVVQYATFASARRFLAGNLDVGSQQDAGNRKFAEVATSPVVAPLLQNGWFTVKQGYLGPDVPDNYPPFKNYDAEGGRLFQGAVVEFTANLLNFQVPFFGSTVKTDASGNHSGGFTVYINSFLGREPTFSECKSLWDQRWQAIERLSDSYTPPDGTGAVPEVIDNGC